MGGTIIDWVLEGAKVSLPSTAKRGLDHRNRFSRIRSCKTENFHPHPCPNAYPMRFSPAGYLFEASSAYFSL